MIIIVYNNLYKKRKCWSLSASLTYFVLNKSMKLISVLKFNWSMNKLQQQLQRSASGCLFNIKWNIEVMSCYEWIKIRWHPISFVCLYFKINEFGKFFYKLKIISFYSPLSYWRLCVVNFFYLHCFYLFKQSAHFKYIGKAQCCRQEHGNNEKNTRLSVKLLDDLRTWVPRRMVCDIIEHLSR